MHTWLLLVILGLVGAGVAFFMSSRSVDDVSVATETSVTTIPSDNQLDPQSTTEVPEDSTVSEPVDEQLEAEVYADGTYTKTGAYVSPAGNEEVEISITLENGVVTESSFEGRATNPGSVRNQERFAEGFQAEVVGKSIDEIDLTVVNGSSLTPIGFMNALADIKADARG